MARSKKLLMIWGLLTIVVILWTQSDPNAYAADRFYYGAYIQSDEYPDDDYQFMADSMGFNIVLGPEVEDAGVRARLQASGMKQVAYNGLLRYYGRGHYMVWEAEGTPSSKWELEWSQGELVEDDNASGGYAIRFIEGDHDADTVIWGPHHVEESVDPSDQYTARFRIRGGVPPDSGIGETDTVAVIMVWTSQGGFVASDPLLNNELTTSYDEYVLFYQINGTTFTPCCGAEPLSPDTVTTEYKIYWYGNRDIFVDRVRVYDDRGYRLFTNAGVRDPIQQAVQEAWVDTSFVYRWYLQDEPNSIDRFGVYREIDSLISNVDSTHKRRPGMACMYRPNLREEFAHLADPAEFMQDWYPISPRRDTATFEAPCNWYSGDTLSLQCAWLSLSSHLDQTKRVALEAAKDFWVVIQAFEDYDDNLNHRWRMPIPNELACNVHLALAYGADGIVHFLYYGCGCRTPDPGADSILGLLPRHSCWPDTLTPRDTTDQWRMLKDNSDRIRKLGDCAHKLDWLGAGLNTDTDTIGGCFVDSLKSDKYGADSAYIHLAFFDDNADTDYVMLINRRCLSTEEQNVTVYIDSAQIGNKKMWYVIDQYSQDTTFTGAIDGAIPFTTHLDPGEGKLFKLAPFPDSAFHGTAHPLTWQGGIMVDGDVTVDSGKTLFVLPPAEIVFYANTDVMQTWDSTDCDFVVNGGLRAVGTEGDSIVFISTQDTLDTWEGIRAVPPFHELITSYCVVGGAYHAIDVSHAGDECDSVTNSRFHNNNYAVCIQNGRPLISDNVIEKDIIDPFGCPTGIWIDNVFTGTTPCVSNNSISGYWWGIKADNCSTEISGNALSDVALGIHSYGCCYLSVSETDITGQVSGTYLYGQNSEIHTEDACFKKEDGFVEWGVVLFACCNTSIRHTTVKNFRERGFHCNGCPADLGTHDSWGHNQPTL